MGDQHAAQSFQKRSLIVRGEFLVNVLQMYVEDGRIRDKVLSLHRELSERGLWVGQRWETHGDLVSSSLDGRDGLL